jgi:hypothetical protein
MVVVVVVMGLSVEGEIGMGGLAISCGTNTFAWGIVSDKTYMAPHSRKRHYSLGPILYNPLRLLISSSFTGQNIFNTYGICFG